MTHHVEDFNHGPTTISLAGLTTITAPHRIEVLTVVVDRLSETNLDFEARRPPWGRDAV